MAIHNSNHSNREPRRSRKQFYKFYTYRTCEVCGHEIVSPEDQKWDCAFCASRTQDAPLSVGTLDLDQLVTKDLETSHNSFMGPLEPPSDYRIFNQKQADGTYPPLSKFFDDAVAKADAGKAEIDAEPLGLPEELGTHTHISGGEVIEFGSPQWFNNIKPLEF